MLVIIDGSAILTELVRTQEAVNSKKLIAAAIKVSCTSHGIYCHHERIESEIYYQHPNAWSCTAPPERTKLHHHKFQAGSSAAVQKMVTFS
jgi:hypothetical protein